MDELTTSPVPLVTDDLDLDRVAGKSTGDEMRLAVVPRHGLAPMGHIVWVELDRRHGGDDSLSRHWPAALGNLVLPRGEP